MTPNPFIKQYLMTAGPTPLPPKVSQVMAEPVLVPPRPAFMEVYERVLNRLPAVFQSANDVLVFASSGSGAMESAAANLARPGVKVLACAAGKFGERWIQLCEAYGADLVRYEPGWGAKLDPAEIDRLVGEQGSEVVFATLERDLDRHRARHPGDRRGGASGTARSSSSMRSPGSAPRRSSRTSGASTSSSPARRRR